MKKNFFKKLALVMALTLAVGSVPATNAEAAAAPKFKSAQATVKVGQTKNYGIANVSAWSVKKIVVGNKKVATVVKNGKKAQITGVAEGKTTVRADLMAYKSKRTLPVRIPVVVKSNETAIVSVLQNTASKVTATFEGDTSAVALADFSVVKDEDNSVIAIKSVTVDTADKSKVAIETYAGMTDGKTYTVTFKEKSKAQFTATDNTVANVNLDTFVVTAAKAEPVKVQTLDAKGVLLGTYTLTNAGSNNLEFTIETTDGYVDGDKVYLSEVGKTATAKVVYHTWKYDESGNETGKIEKEFTITAVKDATVVSNYVYTIATAEPAWDSSSFKANTTLSASDTGMKAFFNIKDSKDNAVDLAAYTAASSDTSKLIVAETTLDGGVDVIGVSAGTAYILIKDADGNTVKTLPVTIVADRKATSLTVDASAFVLSNVTAARDTKEVKLTVKDQYGKDMAAPAASNITVTALSAPKDANKADLVGDDKFVKKEEGKLIFTGEKATAAGTYTFKVEVKVGEAVVERTITVTVKTSEATEAASYELVVAGVDAKNTVDVAVAANATTAKATEVTFKLAKKDAKGVLIGWETTGVTYTVKHSSGTPLTPNNSKVALTTANDSTVALVDGVKTGVYNVVAKFTVDSKEKTFTKTFTVADSQVLPTITIKDTDAEGATIEAALAASDDVVYYYDGTNYAAENSEAITVVAADTKGEEGTVFVKTVTVTFPVNNSVNRTVTLNVNKTFTNVAYTPDVVVAILELDNADPYNKETHKSYKFVVNGEKLDLVAGKVSKVVIDDKTATLGKVYTQEEANELDEIKNSVVTLDQLNAHEANVMLKKEVTKATVKVTSLDGKTVYIATLSNSDAE